MKGRGMEGKGSEGRLPPLKFKSGYTPLSYVYCLSIHCKRSRTVLVLYCYPKAFTVSHPVSDPQARLAPGLPPAKSGPAKVLICAPVLQAYEERMFSVCGLLYSGGGNAMFRSVEMRVCLKRNH